MRRIDLSRPDLAINGGTPLRTASWQDNITTGEEEKLAALRVLDSGYLSLFEGSHTPDPPFSFFGGSEVQALEREWREYYGIAHAVSVNSATSGLYAAIGALGLGYGDEVIVSPYTMSACAMAPLIYGAIPVFADVDPDTGCLDPDSIKDRMTDRTRGIMIVHQFGFPADMDRIMAMTKPKGVYVIEDCAQAHGAMCKGRPVGTIGDIGVFSLNVNKTIQTGEGGVCVTHDPDLCYRLQLIRNHGEAVVGLSGYDNITNIGGFNYRLTEIGAAIAREQLKKLRVLNQKRLDLVEQFRQGLKTFDFLHPLPGPARYLEPDACTSTYYVVPLRYLAGVAGVERDSFIKAVNAEGALFYQGYTSPLYLQPLYQQKKLFKSGYPFAAPVNQGCRQEYGAGLCPVAERLHREEMVINEHIRPPQSRKDVQDLIQIIQKVTG